MLEYFYHKTLRKITVGFGTLFNDIHIEYKNSDDSPVKRIKVPLYYSPKQKFVARKNASNPDLTHNIEIQFPRMGYEMTGISYDSLRKMNTVQKSGFLNPDNGSLQYRYERVPYNVLYSLHIITKNTDDALQILEQILPYFSPDFNLVIKEIGIDSSIDVPISIQNITIDEDYEGNLKDDSRKTVKITIQFIAKCHLYGPNTKSKIITTAIVDFYDKYDINVAYPSATGSTLETMIFTVTGGATAGSIGLSGTIDTTIIQW